MKKLKTDKSFQFTFKIAYFSLCTECIDRRGTISSPTITLITNDSVNSDNRLLIRPPGGE